MISSINKSFSIPRFIDTVFKYCLDRGIDPISNSFIIGEVVLFHFLIFQGKNPQWKPSLKLLIEYDLVHSPHFIRLDELGIMESLKSLSLHSLYPSIIKPFLAATNKLILLSVRVRKSKLSKSAISLLVSYQHDDFPTELLFAKFLFIPSQELDILNIKNGLVSKKMLISPQQFNFNRDQ